MTKAVFTGLSDTLTSNGGFTVSTTVDNDTLRVVVFSSIGDTLAPGVHLIGRLCFNLIDDVAHLNMTVPITLHAVEIGNETGELVDNNTSNGEIQIGVRGDVNLKGMTYIGFVVL